MSKGIVYFCLLIVIFGGFYLFTMYREQTRSALLTQEAMTPDLLLDYTTLHLRKQAYDRSLSLLDQAIDAMRNIEADMDEESKRIVDLSIDDLEKVRAEIEADSLVTEDINTAFTKALNALTIAELKTSEVLLKNDQPRDAIIALKYGMLHMKNALRYVEGGKKEEEIDIYREIDSLLDNKAIPEDEMILRLESMIAELDTLIEDL